MNKAETRTIQLRLPSKLGYERVAMDAAGAAAKLMGFHVSRVEDLRTAVSEAIINAMEHAHKFNAKTKVVVGLTIGEDSLLVDVADQGNGMPESVVTPDITSKFEGEQGPRGWGMFLIKSLMDEVHFNVNSEQGNLTRMVIRLDPPESDEEEAGA
jgi:serine/threonine-protein kinase RsbW